MKFIFSLASPKNILFVSLFFFFFLEGILRGRGENPDADAPHTNGALCQTERGLFVNFLRENIPSTFSPVFLLRPIIQNEGERNNSWLKTVTIALPFVLFLFLRLFLPG